MTYKDTLFFVGKCLTINHEQKNKITIEEQLQAGLVDWDAVVKLSTGHYVFPALYLNLQRAGFLHYLPEDLVGYMKHITNLNRERNEQIIDQAKEINELLLANNITPIFLKGTGNLLEGLYEDIGERMVGDIDFIVDKKDYQRTIEVLKNNNYKNYNTDKYPFPHTRHYARIIKEDSIAAVEIHDELTTKKYFSAFGHKEICTSLIKNKNCETFPSYEDQLCMAIISKHINDQGYLFFEIALKNSYDVYLLSKKINCKKATEAYKRLTAHFNNYIAASYYVLGKPNNLQWKENRKTKLFLKRFHNYLDKRPLKKFELINRYVTFQRRLSIIKDLFLKKEMRQWFFEIIHSKDWQTKKLKKLGLK